MIWGYHYFWKHPFFFVQKTSCKLGSRLVFGTEPGPVMSEELLQKEVVLFVNFRGHSMGPVFGGHQTSKAMELGKHHFWVKPGIVELRDDRMYPLGSFNWIQFNWGDSAMQALQNIHIWHICLSSTTTRFLVWKPLASFHIFFAYWILEIAAKTKKSVNSISTGVVFFVRLLFLASKNLDNFTVCFSTPQPRQKISFINEGSDP